MNLRQWGDAIAGCMIEWDHAPVRLGQGEWANREKVRYTYLQHIAGAMVGLHTSPESVICPGCPALEKDVPESGRLIFSFHWPRDDRYGWSMPNRYTDTTNYRATVSADRTPQSVVSNISERFLRPYLRKWYKLEKTMLDAIEQQERTLAMVNELCAAIGKEPYPPDWFNSNRTSANVAFFEISKWGTIHLTRRYSDEISPDLARKMLLLYTGQADIVEPDPVPIPIPVDDLFALMTLEQTS